MCLALDMSDAYPIVNAKRKYAPCWLRIEQNSIDRPMEVVDLLQKEANLHICLAQNHNECKASRCEHGSYRWEECPLVHLYVIHKQGNPTPVDDHQLRLSINEWRASSISKAWR